MGFIVKILNKNQEIKKNADTIDDYQTIQSKFYHIAIHKFDRLDVLAK